MSKSPDVVTIPNRVRRRLLNRLADVAQTVEHSFLNKPERPERASANSREQRPRNVVQRNAGPEGAAPLPRRIPWALPRAISAGPFRASRTIPTCVATNAVEVAWLSESSPGQVLRQSIQQQFRIKAALLTLCLLSVALTGFAQTQKQKAEEDETTIRISTEIVVLDAQVLRKKTGVVVSTLNKDDFEVYEDGVKQELSFFGKDKLPLSIMLLIDTSGSVRPVIEIIRDGALEALRRLKPEDEVAVMVFGDQTKLIQPFTKNRQQVVDQIGGLLKQAQVGVGTSLHTALHEAAAKMETASNPLSRRVIVTVTDNIATAYRYGDLAEQAVTDRIYDTGSVVCGVVVKTGAPRALNIFGRVQKEDPFRRTINLEKFVDDTGGEIQFVPVIEVNQKLTELIDHLRTRYSLGYTSTNPNLDGKFRRVRVAVTKAGLKREGEVQVRTRQGYYGRERK